MRPAGYKYWLGVCLLAVFAAGCDVMSLPFFLTCPEPTVDPLMHRIASEDKAKEVSAVVLVSSGMEMRTELLQADRELNLLLVRHLNEGCKRNKEKVKIIPASKVENFKSEHTDWQTLEPVEIGRHFRTDWVIFLEIQDMSMYEKGGNMLFHGKAEIKVSLIDVKHPGDSPTDQFYTGQYPSEFQKAMSDTDISPTQFRHNFLNFMAERISWYFTAHLTESEQSCH